MKKICEITQSTRKAILVIYIFKKSYGHYIVAFPGVSECSRYTREIYNQPQNFINYYFYGNTEFLMGYWAKQANTIKYFE